MAQTHYKSVTTDASQCGGSDSTDFSVLLAVTDADLRAVAFGGYVAGVLGYDIRPYSDAALSSPIAAYQLLWYGALNGDVEMRVKFATLSASTNQTIYLGFGDATLTTDGSSTSAWDSHTLASYTFGLSGIWGHLADATGNAYDLTNHSATDNTTGQIFYGASTAAGTSQYLDNTSMVTAGQGAGTLSGWFKINNSNGVYFLSLPDGSSGSNGWDFRVNADEIKFDVVTGGGLVSAVANTGTAYRDGNFHLIHGVYNGSNLQIYFDGTASGASQSQSGTIQAADSEINIGRFGSFGAHIDGASYDDIRVSDNARGANWITAEYNNQKTSSTFLTWGSLTPVGAAAGNPWYAYAQQ